MEKEKSDKIAKMILEVIPLAMREIRTEMRAAAKSELTVPQFRILASIFRGNDKAKDIATHQGVSQAAISKMIDGLVVRGLVERKQAEDRRHYKLSLTEQGQTFFSATQKITQAALRKKIIKMSPEEKLSLESGLKMLQKLLLVLPILFMTIPTHATTLSWNQCIERAARDNAEFQVAKNNLQAAMAQQDGSYSGFLPQVSASANYSYDKSENAGRVDGPSSSYSTSLNATQNLFSGLQDKAKVDQAKANVGVSQSNLRNAQAKLSFDLKSAYMGLCLPKILLN